MEVTASQDRARTRDCAARKRYLAFHRVSAGSAPTAAATSGCTRAQSWLTEAGKNGTRSMTTVATDHPPAETSTGVSSSAAKQSLFALSAHLVEENGLMRLVSWPETKVTGMISSWLEAIHAKVTTLNVATTLVSSSAASDNTSVDLILNIYYEDLSKLLTTQISLFIYINI